MPVSFRILKSYDMAYVRYEGIARIEESLDAFAKYSAHPDCKPGQRQFVDFSKVTEIERNYTKIMEMQARKVDIFVGGDTQTIIVYYSPTEVSQTLAGIILRSWEAFSGVVPVIAETEEDALHILGLEETSISQLLATAA